MVTIESTENIDYVRVYDMLDKKIFEDHHPGKTMILPMQSLQSTGIFILEIRSNSGIYNEKIVY